MESLAADADRRLHAYCESRRVTLKQPLGFGIDGTVWESSRQSALKALYRMETYERERDCYRRLFQNDVARLVDFQVPQLLDYDNSLQVIEMTIVFPPCILDFGKARRIIRRTS